MSLELRSKIGHTMQYMELIYGSSQVANLLRLRKKGKYIGRTKRYILSRAKRNRPKVNSGMRGLGPGKKGAT